MIPTIEEVMKCYRIVAQTECMKTGRPSERTVANALLGTTIVCEAAGVALSERTDTLTRRRFESALAAFMQRGLKRITAWSYICQVRAVFAKWALPYYRDAGWEIPPLELPVFRAKAPRYSRPSAEMLERVKAWYATLKDARWFAATMMLEFAMRNGDVLRLTEANFVTRAAAETGCDGGRSPRHYLSYTPHKTELTSGRHVYWPIHDDIWAKFRACGGVCGLDVTDETFAQLNAELRALGFHGSKAAYELRKICIDHVYQRFGAEMAVSISGDDIKTITRYYADPAQPNIGALRVLDLL